VLGLVSAIGVLLALLVFMPPPSLWPSWGVRLSCWGLDVVALVLGSAGSAHLAHSWRTGLSVVMATVGVLRGYQGSRCSVGAYRLIWGGRNSAVWLCDSRPAGSRLACSPTAGNMPERGTIVWVVV
jgi:hypothetical protein